MKYNDLSTVETEITNNDYVTFDVKQKKKGRQNKKERKLHINFDNKIFDLLLIPIVIGTVVSLGFLIAQIAEYATLSAVANSLNMSL